MGDGSVRERIAYFNNAAGSTASPAEVAGKRSPEIQRSSTSGAEVHTQKPTEQEQSTSRVRSESLPRPADDSASQGFVPSSSSEAGHKAGLLPPPYVTEYEALPKAPESKYGELTDAPAPKYEKEYMGLEPVATDKSEYTGLMASKNKSERTVPTLETTAEHVGRAVSGTFSNAHADSNSQYGLAGSLSTSAHNRYYSDLLQPSAPQNSPSSETLSIGHQTDHVAALSKFSAPDLAKFNALQARVTELGSKDKLAGKERNEFLAKSREMEQLNQRLAPLRSAESTLQQMKESAVLDAAYAHMDAAYAHMDSLPQFEVPPGKELEFSEGLGGGVFGVVFKYEMDGKEYAVKALPSEGYNDPQAVADFAKECELHAELDHENVVKFMGVVHLPDENGTLVPCAVMEFCNCGSAESFFKSEEGKNLPLDQKIKVVQDIARGMQHMEEQGILHRDVAARNVMINKEKVVGADGTETFVYTAKVADFGRGERAQPVIDGQGNTTQGFYDDSTKPIPVRWTSPEAQAHGEYSHQSDVWALGITALEIVTGERPFQRSESSVMDFNDVRGHLAEVTAKVSATSDPEKQRAILGDLLVNRQMKDFVAANLETPEAQAALGHGKQTAAMGVAMAVYGCLHTEPGERPSFESIVQQLGNFAAKAPEGNRMPLNAPSKASIPDEPEPVGGGRIYNLKRNPATEYEKNTEALKTTGTPSTPRRSVTLPTSEYGKMPGTKTRNTIQP